MSRVPDIADLAVTIEFRPEVFAATRPRSGPRGTGRGVRVPLNESAAVAGRLAG